MCSEKQLSPDLGGTKHDFAPTYDRAWPHDYLKAHLALDYVIPQNAKPVFERVMADCMRVRGKDRLKIVDVGCSYGINAALLKCEISLDDLYAAAVSQQGPLSNRNIEAHHHFFAERTVRKDLSVVGLDPAVRAAKYAVKAGLIDAAVTTDLERHELSAADAALVADADMIISTGCVGYVTDRTFARLYAAVGRSKPWVACFVMHPFSYADIKTTLAGHGLETSEIETHRQRQRRFSTKQEKRSILASMRSSKMDDCHERATGYVYASFHLSRPK